MPGIACPTCGVTLSETTDTRTKEGYVARKRKCFNGHTYRTVEQLADDFPEKTTEVPSLKEMDHGNEQD